MIYGSTSIRNWIVIYHYGTSGKRISKPISRVQYDVYEKKKNVDVEGLTTYARNSLLGIGTIIILAGFMLNGFVYSHYFEVILMAAIIGGVIILIFGARKYDHNK